MKPQISQLSSIEKKRVRKQWKQDQRNHRARKRAIAAVMNLTPESIDEAELEPNLPINVRQNLVDEQPRASTPPRITSVDVWQAEKAKMRRKIHKMRKEMEAAKSEAGKLRKQIKRLMKTSKKEKCPAKENTLKRAKKVSKQRKENVINFLCRDENSRLLAGKKDTITKNKTKRQRRVLVKPLTELHMQYNVQMQQSYKLSYRQFVRYCPFYVTQPKASDRNTCACMEHENIKLMIEKLRQKGLLASTSISQLLSAIVCSLDNKECMYRVCAKCCYNEIEGVDTHGEENVIWYQWIRKSVPEEKKNYTHFVKEAQTGTLHELLKSFNKKLDSLAKHHFNWLHQAKMCRTLKETLTEDEVVLHIDFSENFSCKLNSEVQAFHFGGSRKQATVHTCVAYTAHCTQSYATISASLRHDERAVWAHLEPVLKDVMENHNPKPKILHVMSDGPVTQYRNKKNFYLLSTIPFLSGFKQVTWNFSEKSHGKGAPDGVGGAVKRTADSAVRMGVDVQTPEDFYKVLCEKKSDIKYFWVSEENIARYDEAVPEVVPSVKGTMMLHQVISTEPGKIIHREISCFCSRPHTCQCYNAAIENLKVSTTQASAEDDSDLNGKFIVVKYECEPFVGQVLQVLGDEIEVSHMRQLGQKNKFTWPHPADTVFYYKTDVLKKISEPEPLNSRHTQLTHADWDYFSALI